MTQRPASMTDIQSKIIDIYKELKEKLSLEQREKFTFSEDKKVQYDDLFAQIVYMEKVYNDPYPLACPKYKGNLYGKECLLRVQNVLTRE